MTIQEICALEDKTPVPMLEGTVHKVFPKKTLPSKNPNAKKPTYNKQSFVLATPSGNILVSTFEERLFLSESETGKKKKLMAQKGDNGYIGMVKASYTKDGTVTHLVDIGQGCIISDVVEPQRVQPPPPPKPPEDGMRLALRRMGSTWRLCYDVAAEICPADFGIANTKDVATTLFIEASRAGLKLPAAKPQPPITDPAPAPEPPSQASSVPKLTIEQLATRVIGDLPVTKEMLAGIDVALAFDMVVKDTGYEIPMEYLDRAHDACKAEKKDAWKDQFTERKFYGNLLLNWPAFRARAQALIPATPTIIDLDE